MALVSSLIYMPAAKVGAIGSVRLWTITGKVSEHGLLLAQAKPSKLAKAFNGLRKERAKVVYDNIAQKAVDKARRAAYYRSLHGHS